jgi:uncharacterized membrane protein (DUF106 family)
MLEALNLFLVTTTGHLLDWTLHFPRIVVLIMVGVGEALTITYIQKFTTNQDRLRRMKSDKARLKQLIKQAKKSRDKEAIKRYRSTNSSIATLHMRMELAPIFISLIPIIFLATWAFARLGYQPPRAGDPLLVKAYFPPADIGKLVHMLPQENLDASTGWIQKITEDKNPSGKVANGIALWDLRSRADGRFLLPIRYEGKTTTKELLVDGKKYAEPIQFYNGTGVDAVELVMPEYKPLGIVPGIPWLTFPPWLVGDLIIVIPLSLLLRPVLRVH